MGRLASSAGLLDTAREAFTRALQLTAIVTAVFVAGTAILVALLLRNVRSDSGDPMENRTRCRMQRLQKAWAARSLRAPPSRRRSTACLDRLYYVVLI